MNIICYNFLEIVIVANSCATDPNENPHVASTRVYIVCLNAGHKRVDPTLGINGLTRLCPVSTFFNKGKQLGP